MRNRWSIAKLINMLAGTTSIETTILHIPLVRVDTRDMHTSDVDWPAMVAMTVSNRQPNVTMKRMMPRNDFDILVQINAVAGRRPDSHLSTSNKVNNYSAIPPKESFSDFTDLCSRYSPPVYTKSDTHQVDRMGP